MEIGVIGLGKFGMQLGATLSELGHEVIGLDLHERTVKYADDVLAKAYQGDGADKATLEQLRFQDMDCVVVSVGGNMETSILATLNLHDLKARRIIAKAVSQAHRKVLRRIGAHQVVLPEVDAAVQTAQRLHNPGLLDVLPLDDGVLVQIVTVDKWDGRTLAELNIRNKHQAMVVASKDAHAREFAFVPDPAQALRKGDSLVIIGKAAAIAGLDP
jgi:trk system potassium uptake protein TrkA